MNRSARRVVHVALAACLGWPVAALAQPAETPAPSEAPTATPPPVPPLSESLHGEALEAYESATILLHNGDWAGAMAKYSRAHDLSGDVRLLFDMAICARGMKAYARMQELLVRYQREAGDGMSPESRAEIAAALAAIRNLVGGVRVQVSEAGAALSIDGRAVGVTPVEEPIVLDLGKHTVAAAREGFERAEQTIEVLGGDEIPVSLKLLQPSRLIVDAEPGSSIVVDRREVAADRFEGALSAGVHEIQVTARGKKPFSTHVVLGREETRRMRVNLEDSAHVPVWAWWVGGAAIVAGGAVAGYFIFRPHDDGASQLNGTLGRAVVTP